MKLSLKFFEPKNLTLSQRKRLMIIKLTVVTIFIYILFRPFFEIILTKLFVIPFFSQFNTKNPTLSIVICMVVLILAFVNFFKNYRNKINIASLYILIPILIFYLFYRLSVNSPWKFYEIKNIYISFSDLLLLALVLFIINKKITENHKNKTQSSFIEDNFETFNNMDVLGREPVIKELADKIHLSTTNKTFTIGICGKWGSGKSVILKLIKESLEMKAIVVEYSPWKREKEIEILQDFFEKIEANSDIKKEPKLAQSLIDYADTFLINNSNGIVKSIYTFIKNIFDLSGKSKEEKVKEILLVSKLVILIDDLDRLARQEILEILKLIRNSFDFPNTFFILTYDREHIINLLSNKEKSYINYLDKIFQLEIPVPIYPYSIVKDNLLELIKKDRNDEEINRIKEEIIKLDKIQIPQYEKINIINFFIPNLRDAVRFVNSFNFSYYEQIKSDVKLEDFILLELIKVKFQYVYNLLKEDYYFVIVDGIRQLNDKEPVFPKIKNYYKETLTLSEINYLNEIIKYLFSQHRLSADSICYNKNKLAYFSFYLFDTISNKEIIVIRKSNDFGQITKKLIKWEVEGKIENVFEVLIRIDQYDDFKDFKNIIYALALLSKLNANTSKDVFIQRIKDLYSNNYLNVDRDELKNFILKLLVDKNLPIQLRSEVCVDFITDIIYDIGVVIDFDLQELKKINLSLLKTYYNENGYSKYLLSLYQRNIDNIDSKSIVHITRDANEFIKKIISDSKNTLDFLSDIIVPITKDGYVLSGFIEEIFESSFDNFLSFIEKQPPSIEKYEIQTFLRKYLPRKEGIKTSRYLIEIISDEEIFYLKNNILEKVIFFDHNWEKRIEQSKDYDKLVYSKWVAHNYPITDEEAINGQIYFFKKNIHLDLWRYNLIKAEFYYIVDDFLTFKLNKTKLFVRSETKSKIFKIDIDKRKFTNGENELLFEVENKKRLEHNWPSHLKKGEANPYGFKFNLVLQFEKIQYKNLEVKTIE